MKKILALVLALMMCLVVFAACGGDKPQETAETPAASTPAEDDLAYIKANGKMVVGITLFEPMNYYDENNELTGFETEFTKAVCEKLGVTAEFIEINWDTKEIDLNAKTIDCIWNGMTITDDRKENMEISIPYVVNKQVVVVKKENAEQYKDLALFEGKTIVAEVGSAGETAIADDENLKKATYVSVPKQVDGLLEVKSGTAEAVVLDYVLAKAMVGEGTSYADLAIVEGVDLALEEYGVAFRKGSTAVPEVNKAMEELAADGTLGALAEKYGVALTDQLAK